jgi:hypothetical protein
VGIRGETIGGNGLTEEERKEEIIWGATLVP